MTLDCQACSACCFSQLATYVRVTGDDHARLGEQAEALTYFAGNRCYMRMEAGHCAALTFDAEGRSSCSVYARRPETCRTLERGSPACEAERLLKVERVTRFLHDARRIRGASEHVHSHNDQYRDA